eukprot:TRINITY_DN5650_c0_g1_i1.p1 TRINITY_DN5650_c0_g1~~TRINITY_DN5650_c0_g1_i1.p1  ORF type:complete len:291 (-),score=31.54 TRINITY_DN5650_c0_g1_i1:256-1128(-)
MLISGFTFSLGWSSKKLSKVLVEVKNETTEETMAIEMKLANRSYQYLLVADFMMPHQQRKSRSDRTWFSYTFTVVERAVRFQDTNKHQFKYGHRIKFHKDPITPLTFRFGSMDIPFMFAISYGVHDMHFLEHLLNQLVNAECTLELAVECMNVAKKTQFFNSRTLVESDQEKLIEYFSSGDNPNETLRALFLFYSVSFSSSMSPGNLANLSAAVANHNVELKTILGARHLSDFEARISKIFKKEISAESTDWILLIPLWNAVDMANSVTIYRTYLNFQQYDELIIDDDFH